MEKKETPDFFFFFYQQESPFFFKSKHVYFENKVQGNHLLFIELVPLPKDAMVCKHSEAIFRAFTLPIS